MPIGGMADDPVKTAVSELSPTDDSQEEQPEPPAVGDQSDDSDDQSETSSEAAEDDLSGDRATDRMIRQGEALKLAGTALYKAGEYAAAVDKYKEGYAAVDAGIKGYREAVARELRVNCLNNAAMCHMKLTDWANAVESCSAAITVDGANGKALYRRAAAWHKMERWEEAKSDYKRALEIEPRNKELQVLT